MSTHEVEPFLPPLWGCLMRRRRQIQGLAPLATFYRRYAAGDAPQVRQWARLVPSGRQIVARDASPWRSLAGKPHSPVRGGRKAGVA